MNLKSGSIEGFEGYSQVKSVKEFTTHVEMWLAVKKQEFYCFRVVDSLDKEPRFGLSLELKQLNVESVYDFTLG
jgi:hypothetical protein